ncbi:MAG: hypothetical protein HOI95_15875, partial [Chromatiales bacterium]|nr:hypothetical protein [Chromatiales bacterium]
MTSLSTQSNPGRQHTADPIIDLAAPLYAGLQCRLTPDYGWRRYTAQSHGETPLNVWFSGHIEGVDPAWLLNHFRHDTLDFDELTNWLRGVSGHFALVVLTSQWALAAVDRVRSIPIAAAQVNGVWTLDGQPARLAAHAGFSLDAIEPFAALSLAMAGYTVGRGTLYRPLVVLGPGEVMCFQGGQSQPLRERYYSYRPWRVASVSTETAATQLEECTLAVMEQTLATLDGRPLVVPL